MLNSITKTTKEISDELVMAIKSGEMTPGAEAFYANLRKQGGWGEDVGGVYFTHPDGRKEYKKK